MEVLLLLLLWEFAGLVKMSAEAVGGGKNVLLCSSGQESSKSIVDYAGLVKRSGGMDGIDHNSFRNRLDWTNLLSLCKSMQDRSNFLQ